MYKNIAYKIFEDTFLEGNKTLRQCVDAVVEAMVEEVQVQQLPKPTHYMMEEGNQWLDWIEWNDYKPWQHPDIRKHNHTKAHAIKFDNGAIFDMVNGWRPQDEKAQSIEDIPLDPHPKNCFCNVCYAKKFIQNDVSQQQGQDKPYIPDYAWYNQRTDQFLRNKDNSVLDEMFHKIWWGKRYLFPDSSRSEQQVSTDQRVVPRALLENVLICIKDEVNRIKTGFGGPSLNHWLVHIHTLETALAAEKKDLAAPPRRETYEPHRVCSNYYATSPGSKCFNCGYSKDIHDDRDAKIGRPVNKGRTA